MDVSSRTLKLLETISQIRFKPSCVDLDWTFEWCMVFHADSAAAGWLVNTRFRRPDTSTGEVGYGRGRQEFIPLDASRDAIVKTCWVLVQMIVEHELREMFCLETPEGPRRVFDPHAPLDALCEVSTPVDSARSHRPMVAHRRAG